jgi:topoisomerase-4 subunit A
MAERAGLEDLLDDVSLQWAAVADQLKEVKKTFGKSHAIGARRTQFAEAGSVEDVPLEAMIDREPITVVCSQMGWIRAMTGHLDLSRELKFKDGDGPRFMFHAETTDRILVFGSNGRFYTLSAANLPGGRGMGEPLRLMVDLPNEAEIIDLFIHTAGQKRLVASNAGNGFVVAESDLLAQTRTGKQVLNVGDDVAKICVPVTGDHVAIMSENRKMLVFPVSELPEMGRGKGVRLQKYNSARGKQGVLELDGGLSDAKTFNLEEGLSWPAAADRTRTEVDMSPWIGKRAGVGKAPPYGFPRNNKFE